MIATLFKIAGYNIRKNYKRSALIGGTIFIGTIVFLLCSGLSRGIEETMMKTATTTWSGHVNVTGYYKTRGNYAFSGIIDSKILMKIIDKELSEGDYVVNRYRGFTRVSSNAQNIILNIKGVNLLKENNLVNLLRVTQGKWISLKKSFTVALLETQAKTLYAKIGDIITLSTKTVAGENNAIDVEIVAILKDVGFLSGGDYFTSQETAQALYGGGHFNLSKG